MDIAIVGATGNVGRKTLEVLQQKNLNIDNLYLVASPNSAGKQLEFNGKKYSIENLENYDFSKAKITFFAAGGKISEKFAERLHENYYGSVVPCHKSADIPLSIKATERVRLKTQFLFPSKMMESIGILKVLNRINTFSGNKIKFRIYEPNSIVPNFELWEAVSQNQLQAAITMPGILAM